MKNLLVLLVCVCLFSCKKGKNDNNGPLNPSYGDTLKFDVLGLQDTSLLTTDTLEYNVQIQYKEGRKDDVTLAVSNLPSTMTAGFYPQLDTPTFFSVIRLVTHQTDTGVYYIKVTAAAWRFSKEYILQVRVLPYPINPATAMVGSYIEAGACTNTGNINNGVQISTVSPYFNRIQMKGLWSGSSTINVIADINPADNTVVIPYQEFNGQSFSGSGTYSATAITINYLTTVGILSESCSTVLTKQ